MTDALARVLRCFPDVGISGDGYSVRCPAHDDDRPSLSIHERDGKVLLHCHAGCSFESVVAGLGLEPKDLFEAGPQRFGKPAPRSRVERRIVAAYPYHDQAGRLLYETVRYEPKDFRQRVRMPDGSYRYSLDGVQRVLYRLPDVIRQAQAGGRVYVVEGEKDADALAALGLIATTSPLGAGKWRSEYARALDGADVVIIPDNDDTGEKHAVKIADSVRGHAASVRILRLPDLPMKGDVSDWLEQGGTSDFLDELVRQSSTTINEKQVVSGPRPILRRMDEVEVREINWLWQNWLVMGSLNQLIGDPEVGKSTIAFDLCARVSLGSSFPDGQANHHGPQNVLILAAEDSIETVVKPRLQAARADESRIFYLEGVVQLNGKERMGIRLKDDYSVLLDVVNENQIAFVYIDALSDTLASSETDPNNELQVREALSIPKDLAAATGCCVLYTRHKAKMSGRSSVLGGIGSIAFSAVTRSSLDAVIDPNDPTRRILTRNKSNLAPPVSSLVYRIACVPASAPHIEWIGTDPRSAHDLHRAGEDPSQGTQHAKAMDLLLSVLKDGPVPSSFVHELAGEAGISRPTLQRAATSLDVARHRSGRGVNHFSEWSLADRSTLVGSDETSGTEGRLTDCPAETYNTVQSRDDYETSCLLHTCHGCGHEHSNPELLSHEHADCIRCAPEEFL